MGFTTDPTEARSTPYASDMAKGFNVPIIHVNADDVEGCIAAIRLSMAYRERWERDIVIDLIGYRRYGHNETDEPAYTQPTMAAQIRAHPPVSEIYAEQLVKEGAVTPEDVEELSQERSSELSETHRELKRKIEGGEYVAETSTQVATGELDRTKSPDVDTAVPAERLRSLNEALLDVPESFTIHRKLRKPLNRRVEALTDGGIEFGHAEALAFASLLTEGMHIRLTGQDTIRGTFSHRHLAYWDEKTGLKYVPIQNLPDAEAPFELYNSPLSEAGCLGFEYGYSAASPSSLVLWEAQFGDFGNAAQVIIDSFIASGESKWGQTTRLTLLLPHGYEGGGPEHSSARIERFIQLAAEGNMRLANPTTAGQYFHLIRRQALIGKPRPLVVFTPKGLLRLGAASSRLEDLTSGTFQFVLDDPRGRTARTESSGWCSAAASSTTTSMAMRSASRPIGCDRPGRAPLPVRPRPAGRADRQLPDLEQVVWAQEEPKNMGAWSVMWRRLPELIPEGSSSLRRPSAARQPERGLSGRAPQGAGADRADGADLGERCPADHRDGKRLTALWAGANPPPGAMLVAARAAVLALESDHAPDRLPGGRTAGGHVCECGRRRCHAANPSWIAGTFLWTPVQTLHVRLVRRGQGIRARKSQRGANLGRVSPGQPSRPPP